MSDLRFRFIVCGPAPTETCVCAYVVGIGIYMLKVSSIKTFFSV